MSLVLATDCADQNHPDGPHHHVALGETCPHGKPLRYACHTCDFGTGS